MAKKIINPFREARSVNEFFKMLRVELTRLRGGTKFRQWKWGDVFVRRRDADGDALGFWLDADRTLVQEKGNNRKLDFSWYDLAENNMYWVWLPKPLRNWSGFNLFSSGGGGSGMTSFSLRYYADINLRHLPRIKKMLRVNDLIKERRGQVLIKSEEHQMLWNQYREAQARVNEHETMLYAAFDTKYPKFDIITGKAKR